MGKHKTDDQLDAFGHLTWTVGNEDWTACFDAIRVGDKVRYHVVVDCESGGFVDTLEQDEVPVSEAVAKLSSLPDYWYSIACENYATEDTSNPESRYYLSDEETAAVAASWKEFLGRLTQPA